VIMCARDLRCCFCDGGCGWCDNVLDLAAAAAVAISGATKAATPCTANAAASKYRRGLGVFGRCTYRVQDQHDVCVSWQENGEPGVVCEVD
jgi:hypothetical protein